MRQADDALRRGCGEDAFLSGLIGKFPAGPKREAARQLLGVAIHDFDEAAIFTIHGFCQRMLHENAFESGSAFDAELLPELLKVRGNSGGRDVIKHHIKELTQVDVGDAGVLERIWRN